MTRFDVIVIGSGAAGGTLAHRLAPSGASVLLVERGDWLPREPENWSPADVLAGRDVSRDTWHDERGRRFQPPVHYFVGGATKLYGGGLYRLREADFGELRHCDGSSPAWPVGYDELESYYTEAEQLYRVHGHRGEDPTEPWASAPYPAPPVSHEPRVQQLADAFAAAGAHPFHAPCGVLLDERDAARSPCVRCATCDGFPCLVHAKCDAEVIAVRPALAHPRVSMLARTRVLRLETDASGRRVTGVVVERDGARDRFAADLVVIACGAANSAALLLRSACAAHPDGLANGSGEVGRNLMFHTVQTAIMALPRNEPETAFQRSLAVHDFYLGSERFGHPLGSIVLGGARADEDAGPTLAFRLATEDLPLSSNRVTLHPDGRIAVRHTATNRLPAQRLLSELVALLRHSGMRSYPLVAHRDHPTLLTGLANQAGTCRFGDDPATSVLDRDCRAHELDNLYVADTSCFPSIGAVDPALTAMANALRVGDHLLGRLGVRQASSRPRSRAQATASERERTSSLR
jgi:choline dehydrogenase-like flavoprotein